jgi:hypothetical protein
LYNTICRIVKIDHYGTSSLFLTLLITLFASQINQLNPSTIGMGVLVLVIGLSLRVAASFLAVSFSDLTLKERLFVALAWLPKATVQAALGPLALVTIL